MGGLVILMTSGPGKGSQARLSDVAQQEGHLAPRSATWHWPQLQGHGRLVKLAKTYLGNLPRYGKTPSRIGRTSQHGGPLAGRLPKWAKEAERAALQEIRVQRASEKKRCLSKSTIKREVEWIYANFRIFFRCIVKGRLRLDPSHLCKYLTFSQTLMHSRACGHRTFCVFCVCLSRKGKIVSVLCLLRLEQATECLSLISKINFKRPGGTIFSPKFFRFLLE